MPVGLNIGGPQALFQIGARAARYDRRRRGAAPN